MDVFGRAIDLLTNTYNDEIAALTEDFESFLNASFSTTEFVGLGLCGDSNTFLLNIDFGNLGGGGDETTDPPVTGAPPSTTIPPTSTTPLPTPTPPPPNKPIPGKAKTCTRNCATRQNFIALFGSQYLYSTFTVPYSGYS